MPRPDIFIPGKVPTGFEPYEIGGGGNRDGSRVYLLDANGNRVSFSVERAVNSLVTSVFDRRSVGKGLRGFGPTYDIEENAVFVGWPERKGTDLEGQVLKTVRVRLGEGQLTVEGSARRHQTVRTFEDGRRSIAYFEWDFANSPISLSPEGGGHREELRSHLTEMFGRVVPLTAQDLVHADTVVFPVGYFDETVQELPGGSKLIHRPQP